MVTVAFYTKDLHLLSCWTVAWKNHRAPHFMEPQNQSHRSSCSRTNFTSIQEALYASLEMIGLGRDHYMIVPGLLNMKPQNLSHHLNFACLVSSKCCPCVRADMRNGKYNNVVHVLVMRLTIQM